MNVIAPEPESLPPTEATGSSLDWLQIASVAVIVYAICTVAHEGIGHGLTTYLLGGKVNLVSSVACDCDGRMLSPWSQRAINAGGSGAQAMLALVIIAALRSKPRISPLMRYFLWLLTVLNVFQVGGYLMVPTLIGFGDWDNFQSGLEAAVIWRISFIMAGAAISIWGLRWGLREVEPFLGTGPDRRVRALKLTLIPYFTGGILDCVSAILNPGGWILLLISAVAASFGGAAFLAWMSMWVQNSQQSSPIEAIGITRNSSWIAAAVIVSVLFVGWLGPGIKFSP